MMSMSEKKLIDIVPGDCVVTFIGSDDLHRYVFRRIEDMKTAQNHIANVRLSFVVAIEHDSDKEHTRVYMLGRHSGHNYVWTGDWCTVLS